MKFQKVIDENEDEFTVESIEDDGSTKIQVFKKKIQLEELAEVEE